MTWSNTSRPAMQVRTSMSDAPSLDMPTAWPSELPSYPKYPGRAVQVLTGDWEFGYSASYNCSSTTSLDGLTFDQTQAVPAAWDGHMPMSSCVRATG